MNFTERLSRRDFLSHSSQTAATVSAAAMLLTKKSQAASGGNKKIKIGQIGVGHAHAEGKMEAYRQSADFEVVGVVEPDAALRREAEQSEVYQGLRWMTQEELLNTSGLKSVAVETQVADLLDVAEDCVAAGKHIHLDKPAGASLLQFKSILDAADKQGLTVQMGYMYRYNPAVLLMHDLLSKGWLGEIFEIHTVMSKEVGESKRLKWSNLPGGTMFELGCHLIDLVVGVLGKPDSISSFNQQVAQYGDDLIDNMLAVCTYPRAIASIKSSALEVEGFDRRHFVVCGSGGTLHIQPLDDPSVRLALSESHGKYQTEYQQINFPEYNRYVADAVDFAKIIRNEKASDYKSDHDLAVQETVLKASELPLDSDHG